MTVVNFDVADEVAAAGFDVTDGELVCRYANDFMAGDTLVTTKPFTVELVAGAGSADIYPTPIGNGLIVRVRSGRQPRGVRTRTVAVPDSPTPVNFVDLVEVVVATGLPAGVPDAIAQGFADVNAELETKVPDARTVNGHPLSDDVTLSKSDVGLSNVNNTADSAKPVSTQQAAAIALRVDKPAGPMEFVIYGASQSVDPGLQCTPGLEWFKQVADELGTTIASLAYSGRRTIDMAGYALSGTTPVTGQGAHPSGAAATWAGMDTVGKIPIIDASMNDIGHYPSMAVTPAVPARITGAAGTRYLAGIAGSLRTLLATLIAQSRVENTAAASTGTWSTVPVGSAGTTAYSTAVGATRTYTVTPPQGGEFAGEVYHVGVTLSAEQAAVSAPFTYSVDGGAESAVQTPPGWQRYVGWGGANIDSTPFVTKIAVPVDGNSHTVRITHAGAAGNVLYSDCLLVPSAAPKPVLVLGAPRQVKVAAGVFDAAGVAAYAANWRLIEDQQKAICAEFPNAIYVPCNVSLNGLSNADGLHFNDRGMEQRKNDVLSAIYDHAQLRAALLGNKSRAAADGNYAML